MQRARVLLWITSLFALVLLLPSCVRTVDSGRAAVLWTLFGGTQEDVYGEGVHLIAPWNRFTRYDVRTQDQKELLHVLSWKGIEATEKIAQSANAKVVVIGSGKDGLPLILGGQ
jgi:regulator of protease activity HflC (stomatin/prohibitin superfamily)